nr:MAG TPA: hypothetical protein [Caudoviricetes sp.]
MNQYYTVYPDELYHHGIKGMKWGIRRSREELGYPPQQKRKNKKSLFGLNSNKKKKVKKISTKGSKDSKQIIPTKDNNFYDGKRTNAKAIQNNLDQLTTQELESFIKRLNTEKTLAEIVKSQQAPSRVEKIDKMILNLDKQYKTINTLYTTVSTSKLAKDICEALDLDSSWVKPNSQSSTINYLGDNKDKDKDKNKKK